ncbi:MAG: HAD-IB family hydrolase [Clostridia bacterium]|nr:HAD-IB family hydrolase [Clostridia bacterium]
MERVAIFDFDGTVIRGDSVVALLLFARKRRIISFQTLIRAAWAGMRYRVGLCDALTAKRASHAFLCSMPQKKREAFLRDFAKTLADRAYPDAMAQIAAHKSAGDTVLLCSASCSCYMRYAAPLIGADALLCTPCAADGRVIGPNCRGEEKVRRVTAWRTERNLSPDCICAAYGDSRGDAPILRASAAPVLVNAKRGLKRLIPDARQVQWKEAKNARDR